MEELYRPLALRYRPLIFSDVVGQDVVKRVLVGMLKSNRIGTGYLLGGLRGTGKTSVARIFSKSLNCTNKQGYEACCKCKVCVDIQNARSVDVVEIDSASAGSVASIRNLREASYYSTIGGGWRVWILDEVHSTSREGFDALLKVLEEPPPKVVFIMCTTAITKVPDTILSRCFQLPFRAVTPNDILNRLRYVASKEEVKVDDDVLRIIVEKGSGSVRDCLTLLDQLLAIYGQDLSQPGVLDTLGVESSKAVGNLLIDVVGGSQINILENFRKIWSILPDSREFVHSVANHFRNVILCSQDLVSYVSERDRSIAEKLHRGMSDEKVLELLSFVTMLERALRDTRLNPQVVIEMWLLSLLPAKAQSKLVDSSSVNSFWTQLQ